MNASVIIPAQDSEVSQLAVTLQGVFAQRYEDGRIDVCVAQYGGGERLDVTRIAAGHDVRFVSVDHPSPYAARNVAAETSSGDVLLFTEPGCVPDPAWVRAHVDAIRNGATISVGHLAPIHETWALDTFLSYETVRDDWVFSSASWQHRFGRPKNMAVARARFLSHGPFVEVMRGADSKLVQLVARDVSPREVAHAPDAIVRQLSVHGLPSCLRDRFVHARTLRIYRSAHAAPIQLNDRIRILRRTMRERDYGLLRSAALLGALVTGIMAFRLGGASARFAATAAQSPTASTRTMQP
jgi:glycosyltransferase involved in cell wall biosynthesis